MTIVTAKSGFMSIFKNMIFVAIFERELNKLSNDTKLLTIELALLKL